MHLRLAIASEVPMRENFSWKTLINYALARPYYNEI